MMESVLPNVIRLLYRSVKFNVTSHFNNSPTLAHSSIYAQRFDDVYYNYSLFFNSSFPLLRSRIDIRTTVHDVVSVTNHWNFGRFIIIHSVMLHRTLSEIPDNNVIVLRTRDNLKLVKLDPKHPILVSVELLDLLSRQKVPYSNASI